GDERAVASHLVLAFHEAVPLVGEDVGVGAGTAGAAASATALAGGSAASGAPTPTGGSTLSAFAPGLREHGAHLLPVRPEHVDPAEQP
ncbi:MAG TPA: hypothetical protein VHQ45_09370, partial [Gemmatimonadaceae bacterium]|nr:hypothetical protein [Gemmatimonadaceae bacterium]